MPPVGDRHELVVLGRVAGDLRPAVGERRARAVEAFGVADPLHQQLDRFGRRVGQDHRELVAADAGRVVADSQHPAEPVAELAERGVAGRGGPRCR